jgi:hypothetical protein
MEHWRRWRRLRLRDDHLAGGVAAFATVVPAGPTAARARHRGQHWAIDGLVVNPSKAGTSQTAHLVTSSSPIRTAAVGRDVHRRREPGGHRRSWPDSGCACGRPSCRVMLWQHHRLHHSMKILRKHKRFGVQRSHSISLDGANLLKRVFLRSVTAFRMACQGIICRMS